MAPDNIFAQDLLQGEQIGPLILDNETLVGKIMEDCTLVDSTFLNTRFEDCQFTDCEFLRCDFSMAKLDRSRFEGVIFRECKLLGIDWSSAEWPSLALSGAVDFHSCLLNYSSFQDIKLSGLRIINCQAQEVDFSKASLVGADFSGSDLSRAYFSQTDLRETAFERATNYRIDPTQNRLKAARFSMPELIGLLAGFGLVIVDLSSTE